MPTALEVFTFSPLGQWGPRETASRCFPKTCLYEPTPYPSWPFLPRPTIQGPPSETSPPVSSGTVALPTVLAGAGPWLLLSSARGEGGSLLTPPHVVGAAFSLGDEP